MYGLGFARSIPNSTAVIGIATSDVEIRRRLPTVRESRPESESDPRIDLVCACTLPNPFGFLLPRVRPLHVLIALRRSVLRPVTSSATSPSSTCPRHIQNQRPAGVTILSTPSSSRAPTRTASTSTPSPSERPSSRLSRHRHHPLLSTASSSQPPCHSLEEFDHFVNAVDQLVQNSSTSLPFRVCPPGRRLAVLPQVRGTREPNASVPPFVHSWGRFFNHNYINL